MVSRLALGQGNAVSSCAALRIIKSVAARLHNPPIKAYAFCIIKPVRGSYNQGTKGALRFADRYVTHEK